MVIGWAFWCRRRAILLCHGHSPGVAGDRTVRRLDLCGRSPMSQVRKTREVRAPSETRMAKPSRDLPCWDHCTSGVRPRIQIRS